MPENPVERGDMGRMIEWRGYVVRALEDIDRDIKGLSDKVDKIDERLSATNVRVAAIGATVSVIVSLIMWAVKQAIS